MNTNNKKSKIGYIVVFVIGALIGFFGVFNSVFSDGSAYERAVTILVVLIVYAVSGVIIGFIKPIKTMLYLPWLSITGLILLLFYMYKEFNILYLVYFILILIILYFGLKTGSSFTRHKK
ncbi:MAG TPA: hypothetical protein DHU59_00455 [Clostridiales bacterium]|nr:hypothetical protein [Clostridiales bacterium]